MDSRLSVLVVEDDDRLRDAFAQILRDQGDSVFGFKCSEDAHDFTGAIDIAIIDQSLPGEDGLRLIKRLRKNQPAIGIIMLGEQQSPNDRVRGYVNGADNFLSKPTSLDELCGAVSALRRRLKPPSAGNKYCLNPTRLQLTGPNGQFVLLSPREADLLVAFCRAPSYRLDQSFMIDVLHKDAASHPKSALELHILRIRKKILQLGDPGPGIQSIRGWGYQLCLNLIIE